MQLAEDPMLYQRGLPQPSPSRQAEPGQLLEEVGSHSPPF